ncbi:MAG: Si-specific NAD(P)(+) transhydrogenase [Sinimarinibacterium flocculans]|uniref:Si-specific NAD(P)(+) transhydrogenase n=1 Tax=Sinimarinibacterium flocculans TaxID=985250 RepID=UPI003C3FAB8E
MKRSKAGAGARRRTRADRYDVVVIGTGPGGEGAAMMAAKRGRRVAVVERFTEVGGGCTHWGTIPSKALRHAVQQLSDIRANPLLRDYRSELRLSYPQLLHSKDKAVEAQVANRRRHYERNRVPVLEGHARFVDAHTLSIERHDGTVQQVVSEHFVIATGSRPYHPAELDFSHPNIRDSDSILDYPDHPFSVTIYGAGVIGCEYASIFVNLGVKVTLVNTQERLLSFLDEEITEALSYHLREQGCIIRHNEQFDGIETPAKGVVLRLKSGRRIRSDVLLWANGRTGNTDQMNLAALGIEPNGRGQIEVNAHFQTAVPHIYAVGDVIGPPALASAAYVQGRFAAQHLLDPALPPQRLETIPSGIYTIPEISSVGASERELREARVPYEAGRASFKHIARAQMAQQTTGMLKILFHAETLQVLGVHCFGDRASEIVHIGQTVMADPARNSMRYFVDTTFNYPTMAEAYRVAAHNGLNRLS